MKSDEGFKQSEKMLNELEAKIHREYAQAKLEGFILCAILMGHFKWDEEKMGKWYWQSKTEPSLIILRQWVEGK